MRRGAALLTGLLLVTMLGACDRGGAAGNQVVGVANGSSSSVDLEWTGSSTGRDQIDACASSARGFGPGTYHITIRSSASQQETDVQVSATEAPEIWFNVTNDGQIQRVSPGSPAPSPAC
jgi:hypothetical protein